VKAAALPCNSAIAPTYQADPALARSSAIPALLRY